MHYKTIVLELLEGRPQLSELLKKYRRHLSTMEHYAHELQASHEAWQAELLRTRPESDPRQLASEALELAIADIQSRLPSESDTANDPAPWLDPPTKAPSSND